jgi:hypothetical protein
MYGAFFLIGLVSALAGLNNVFAAAHGATLYLLNASSGLVIAQPNLGENVSCVVPFGNEFMVVTTFAGLTHFVLVMPNGTQVPIQNVVMGNESNPALTGSAIDCAAYEGMLVVTINANGTKAYFMKLNGTNLVVEKELKAPEPEVKGGEALLFYGPTGLYLYNEGNFTMIANTTVSDADYMGGVVFYASNGKLYAYSVPSATVLYTWTPKKGKVVAVLAITPNEVIVGMKDTNMGLALLVGGKLKITVGVPNVYMVAKGGEYVGAATKGSLGEGVATVPLSWFGLK